MIPLIFGLPGGAEWIIIIIALLLIFGGSRVAGLGKGTGRAVREFKEEINAIPSTPKKDAAADRVADEVEVKAPAADPTDLR